MRLAYIAFDSVPAPKGASTHIAAFARALAGRFGRLDLITPGDEPQTIERWPGVFHTELPAQGVSLIDRVLCFQAYITRWLRQHPCTIVQFRSPFEGLPLLQLSLRPKLVFEVNGLPSIELKYRYAGVEDDRELMRKLVAQEMACLQAADRVITPSGVTARFLVGERGARSALVIPNGVDLSIFNVGQDVILRRLGKPPRGGLNNPPQVDNLPYSLCYFGSLHSWQGVELAIRALAQVRESIDARLTIIAVGDTEPITRLAKKLQVLDFVSILPAMPQEELAAHICASHAVLAPLALNDRNLQQGCCPLKILEAMACGVPVIAGDLPVVRELGCDGTHFLLVKPGSVDQTADAILRLHSDPGAARRIGASANRHIEQNFTWQHAGAALVNVYEELIRSSKL